LSTYSAGFHIDDEDLEGLASVRDAVNYVALKLQVS
jgi:acyl carrier protein